MTLNLVANFEEYFKEVGTTLLQRVLLTETWNGILIRRKGPDKWLPSGIWMGKSK
jgi:hypothetical protein